VVIAAGASHFTSKCAGSALLLGLSQFIYNSYTPGYCPGGGNVIIFMAGQACQQKESDYDAI
jgi:hypothetical protein